jgi:hypothetical protein
MYSLHGQLFRTGDENIRDFKEALDAEPERRNSRKVPDSVRIRQTLLYRNAVRFSQQVERFYRLFGRGGCLTIFYDDFQADPLAVYREALEFLDLESSFVPSMERLNQSREMRSVWVHRATLNPGLVQRMINGMVPAGLRASIGKTIHRLNTRRLGRTPLPDVTVHTPSQARPPGNKNQ